VQQADNQGIHLLPEHIIDQIKAGEVIERPSTLIKELLENSVDAGSKNISIHLVNNGMDLITVEDDGHGIDFEDLPLAFCRHATSKIDNFEDIYNLYTYGFRGEALASMASISKITCKSSNKNNCGTIKIHGGEVISHLADETQSETGTSIYVKDLFYNTPARLKFIQSKTSEKNQLKKIINAFLLTHPEISFSVKWDEEDREVYPAIAINELEKRIKKMFFRKKDVKLHHLSNEYDDVTFETYISQESNRGNAGKQQYLFINKRFVQDIQLHKVILGSAGVMWPFGETGHYIAFVDLPADQLDVNVHPNKTVVKFYQPARIFSLVSNSIKQGLATQKSFNTPESPNWNTPASTTPTSSGMLAPAPQVDQKEFSYKSTDLYQQDLGHQEELRVIFHKDNYAIVIMPDIPDPFLVNMTHLAWIHFKLAMNEPGQTLPLLVSEPVRELKKTSLQLLNQFNQHGFEIDQMDYSTMIIRAFPQNMDGLPYLEMIQGLAKSSEKSPKKDIMTLIDEQIANSQKLSGMDPYVIKKLIKTYGITSLMENGSTVQLNQQRLSKFFYE
jgi:DNA mismatch repair protein MutL